MTLSKYEQRVLEEMEHQLVARPASTGCRQWWRCSQPRRPRSPRRGALLGLTAAAGLTLLTIGLVAANGIGVGAALIGYALTVRAASSAVTAINHRLRTRAGQKHPQPRNRPRQPWHHDEPGPASAD